MENDMQNKPALKDLPAVDRVIRESPQLVRRWGQERVTAAIRSALEQARRDMAAFDAPDRTALLGRIISAATARLEQDARGTLVSVINLTGTVLHTNLGRAVLPAEALNALLAAGRFPCNLEYELQSGSRGERDDHAERLLRELCGAEAATVVNNNAAAVLLVLNTLANAAEVPVSRGELVEIGGSFRIPEIMRSAGAILVEVGATNRTHLRDYETAINEHTALLLRVHASNYEIRGFTHSVAQTELAELARQHGLPFIVDLGSGSLVDFADFDLPAEPVVAQVLKNGADLVTFSGDKLLGGPQCGIIAGKREWIARLKNNPLKRALRIDKLSLAALVAVLRLYQEPSQLAQKLPTLALLTRPPAEIRAQAERIAPLVAERLAPRYTVAITRCQSQIGSGALPLKTLPGIALRIDAAVASDQEIRRLALALRDLPIPVLGRIHRSALFLDLRCLDREADFIAQLGRICLPPVSSCGTGEQPRI